VKIFGHYPNASPRWQYMNGLIQNSLKMDEMYSEEEVRDILIRSKYANYESIVEWFEQFEKK
jgi:hypothetical protein